MTDLPEFRRGDELRGADLQALADAVAENQTVNVAGALLSGRDVKPIVTAPRRLVTLADGEMWQEDPDKGGWTALVVPVLFRPREKAYVVAPQSTAFRAWSSQEDGPSDGHFWVGGNMQSGRTEVLGNGTGNGTGATVEADPCNCLDCCQFIPASYQIKYGYIGCCVPGPVEVDPPLLQTCWIWDAALQTWILDPLRPSTCPEDEAPYTPPQTPGTLDGQQACLPCGQLPPVDLFAITTRPSIGSADATSGGADSGGGPSQGPPEPPLGGGGGGPSQDPPEPPL